ncbi:MAG: hypothetical protein V3V99_10040 [candidate division Zixibacteria bacterium]
MKKPYEIFPYTINTLKQLLSEKSGALPSIVDSKLHSLYFEHYFTDLNAKTIVVENDYIDRDFMEDYAGFYSRCFDKYESSCTRLHFFKLKFSPQLFSTILINRSKAKNVLNFKKSYLGFIVIKKLPQTFIGRTCLVTYGSDNERRQYPILREYPVSLFGINLTVYKTLAFQEQDRGVAACATSALWSVFQGTGKLFQHSIPSPVEITQIATKFPDENVPGFLPSRGLTGKQEIYAIRQLGLEVDHIDAQQYSNLQGAVYAYLKAGIPLLLRVSLFDITNRELPKYLGGHAMAVTGFSLGKDKCVPYESNNFLLKSSQIDKLYVHDDQVGPFARVELDNKTISYQKHKYNSISTSWKRGKIRAVPRFILIPLYPKIRIRYEFIRNVIRSFEIFIYEEFFKKSKFPFPKLFEWDIYLTTVNKLKSEFRNDTSIHFSEKKEILLKNMPRFIWRVIAKNKNDRLFEFLFDATDIEQGKCFFHAVNHNNVFYSFLKIVSKISSGDPDFQIKSYWHILEWFSKLR